jgi:flagellar capping protein FliD
MPFAEPATGFIDGQDPFRLAGQIGLSVNKDGELELDEEKLDEALTDNYLGTLAVIGAKNTGASDSDVLKFYGATDATTAGVYDVRAVFDGGTLVSAQIKLHSEGVAAWRTATIDGNLIIGASGNPEHNLQVTATYSGSGTQTAEVRVRQGAAGNLYDRIENLLDKTVDLAKKRCDDSVKASQKRIDAENSRLDRYEERLIAQYARLEQALTLLSAQRSALTSYFG